MRGEQPLEPLPLLGRVGRERLERGGERAARRAVAHRAQDLDRLLVGLHLLVAAEGADHQRVDHEVEQPGAGREEPERAEARSERERELAAGAPLAPPPRAPPPPPPPPQTPVWPGPRPAG